MISSTCRVKVLSVNIHYYGETKYLLFKYRKGCEQCKKNCELIYVHLNGKINTFLIVYEGCSETIETFTLSSLKKVNPLKIPPKVHQDKMYKCLSFLVHSII